MNRFERFSRSVLLISVLLALLAACGRSTPAPLTEEMIKNAEYDSELVPNGAVKLTDGKFQKEIVPGAASKLVVVIYPGMYAFGDLNGDGAGDAAVVLAASGGGSGTFISLHAVVNDKGKPKDVASIKLGDRVRVKSVKIESSEITVVLLAHGPSDPMCCPSVKETRRYKLEDNALVRISEGS